MRRLPAAVVCTAAAVVVAALLSLPVAAADWADDEERPDWREGDVPPAPAWSAANLIEKFLATLHIGVVQITRSRYRQATMPHHELIVLLVAHLILAIIRCALEEILIESGLLGHA